MSLLPKADIAANRPFGVFLTPPTMSRMKVPRGRAMNRRELIGLIACTTVGWQMAYPPGFHLAGHFRTAWIT
jgi:hypothetical protein